MEITVYINQPEKQRAMAVIKEIFKNGLPEILFLI